MRYGLPYKGSKNSIAADIINQLPRAHTFIDAFAGGCAITHAAIESGKYQHIIANDIEPTVAAFIRCTKGDTPKRTPTRDEFKQSTDLLERLVWSFGNNTRDYLWAEDIEPLKVAAERCLLAETAQERYAGWRELIRELAAYINKTGLENQRRPLDLERLQCLQGLQRLQGLQGLQCLQGLQGIQGIQGIQGDYRDIPIPPQETSTVIYCDPPYRNTTGYGQDFNFDTFDNWARNQHHPTFISEYTPINGFTVIWQQNKHVTYGDNGNHATELLMVQDHYAHHYTNTLF